MFNTSKSLKKIIVSETSSIQIQEVEEKDANLAK